MSKSESRRFHAIGHAALELWADTRDQALELLGTEGISLTERLRERAHGGSASTKAHRLTAPERQCSAWDRTLRVEQAVRCLHRERRDLVSYRYLRNGPLGEYAKALGVTPSAVSQVLSKVVEQVGRDVAFGDANREALKALQAASRRTRPARAS